MQSRADAFLASLYHPELSFIVEAHSGLAARLAEQAGCETLWASSLSISSMMGVRDANEASWSQIIDIVEWLTQACKLPVLVDGDSGHGDFNTARRFGKKLVMRGAAGVCFEDKIFPKRNSFAGGSQALVDTAEFCGLIAATKDACGTDLVVVARTEALIVGSTMSDALKRSAAYAQAGADAIVVHSKIADASEVLQFAQAWQGQLPLIVIPTTYPMAEQAVLARAGVNAVVWANHALRASAAAMSRVYHEIVRDGRPCLEEPSLAIAELFELLKYDELEIASNRFTKSHPA